MYYLLIQLNVILYFEREHTTKKMEKRLKDVHRAKKSIWIFIFWKLNISITLTQPYSLQHIQREENWKWTAGEIVRNILMKVIIYLKSNVFKTFNFLIISFIILSFNFIIFCLHRHLFFWVKLINWFQAI